MGEAWGLRELQTLKALAEALNEQAALEEALRTALARLVEMMGLRTAWVFLDEGGHGRRLMVSAAQDLPPALEEGGRRALRAGGCDCQDLYATGRLQRAINILTCSRLRKAREGTGGLLYHASALIQSRGRPVGILNVASPGKSTFTDEHLELLEAVASLMGAAVERARLFAAAQRRAVQFQRLAHLARTMGRVTRRSELLEGIPRWVVEGFEYTAAALWLAEGGTFRLGTATPSLPLAPGGRLEGKAPLPALAPALEEVARQREPRVENDLRRVPREGRAHIWRGSRSMGLLPVVAGGLPLAVLQVEHRQTEAFGPSEVDLLSAFAAHVGTVWESLLGQRRRREEARLEERRQVARDLHDSVSQRLFSLKLSARAAQRLVASQPEQAQALLNQVEDQARSALTEMRQLVEQLRPDPAAQGLAGELRRWIDSLFVPEPQKIALQVEPGPQEPEPGAARAALRIAQEAVGNALRHAGEVPIRVRVRWGATHLTLTVTDRGRGFVPGRVSRRGGLEHMRARAREAGGYLRVVSRPGQGTRVECRLPLRPPGPESEG